MAGRLHSGNPLTLSTNPSATGTYNPYARAEGNVMSINMSQGIDSFRAMSKYSANLGWDTVFAHEMGHLDAIGGGPVSWSPSTAGHRIFDPQNPAYIENPYRWWTGQARTDTYGISNASVPFKQSVYQY